MVGRRSSIKNRFLEWCNPPQTWTHVFGECIDNPPLSINPLVSEYSGSKVDSISFKYTIENKFLKGSSQKTGFDVLKLCE